MKKTPEKIVFYDGDCGFCNKTVQFILRHEKERQTHFAALQSSYAKNYFSENGISQPDLSTFYFKDGTSLLNKSDAALTLAKNLKYPFSLLRFLWIVPQYVRDKVYDFIAKRRQKLSGGFCVLPSKKDKSRFLS